MIKSCIIILLLTASSLLAQEAKIDSLKKVRAEEVTVNAERPYSATSDAEFRAADLELSPKNSAQDMLHFVAGFVLRSMQEFSVSYSMDHIEIYANVENPFDLAWNDVQVETDARPHCESGIINDPLFDFGTPRALRLGVGYRF
jgi:hypothetical protein